MPADERKIADAFAGESNQASRSVSVLIPARNAAATIARTLRSLVTDASLIREILVMDDGSTDETRSVTTEMALLYGLPVEVVTTQAGSAGGARNAGIARATGEVIYMLDADDELAGGGLSLLHEALRRDKLAGLAVGANIRRTEGRPDKLKVPSGYGDNPAENARKYLRNGMWPIAMGSALVVASRVGSIRFPEAIGLDEDTCFWAALLARERVATVASPVLLYHHDEARMAERFLRSPRRTLVAISREFNKLAAFGIERETLQWRKAWVALRIARQLLIGRRYDDGASLLRAARAHPEFRHGWKVFQYGVRIRVGRLSQKPRLPASAASLPDRPRRTLIVTHHPAWPPVSGADLRNWGNTMAAARDGPVLLVSVRPLDEFAPTPKMGVAIASLELAGERRTPAINTHRTCVENRISITALERLLSLIKEFRPDAVVVENISLFCLLRPLRPLTRLLVLDMHNVESELVAQENQWVNFILKLKRLLWNEVRRIRWRERNAAAWVDRIWVCSEADRERLLALARPKAVDVVPNGIPRFDDTPPALPPLAPADRGWPVLLFVGHLGYWPNVDAAERLAKVILPRIRDHFPETRLVLAGRYPKWAVKALTDHPGVQLFEHPQDVSALYRCAHLCVAPIWGGGGTRIKIIEAMARGLPVVASPVAVEGLGLADGIDVALANSDEGLAHLACKLCVDPARLQRQRVLAHAWAKLNFGPRAIERAVQIGLRAGANSLP